MLIGLYTSDLVANSDQGFSFSDEVSLPDTVVTTTYLPASLYAKMPGGQIDAIRFGLANDAKVLGVSVYKVNADGPMLIAYEPFKGTATADSWNLVTLSKPCTLPTNAMGVLIGFTYEENSTTAQDGHYPLSVNPTVTGLPMSWVSYYKTAKEGFGWHDYSEYGALSVQAYVSSANIPDCDVVLLDAGISSPMLPAGKEFTYQVSAYNFGVAKINSYKLQTSLDGTVIDVITEEVGSLSGAAAILSHTCVLPANTTRGNHTLSIKVVSVNGAAPTVGLEDDEIKISFGVYNPEDEVKRQMYLVEEFTSHSCTNCPLGAYVLELMQELNDSIALACIHGNLESKDPFNNAEHDALNEYFAIGGWPFASFNRNFSAYDGAVAVGIGYDDKMAASAAQNLLDEMVQTSIPAFATVNIATVVDGSNLNIKVSGQGSSQAREILDAFSLTVYVLENGLVYRQKNLGVWDREYIHNNVIRKVATATNGDDIQWSDGSQYENEYNVTIDEGWDIDNMHVIAFLSKRQPLNNPDYLNMAVTNANKIKITDKVVDPNDKKEDEDKNRYDASLYLSPMTNTCQMMCTGFSPDLKYMAGMNYVTGCAAIWNVADSILTNITPRVVDGVEMGSTFFGVNSKGIAVGSEDGGNDVRALAMRADGTAIELEFDLTDAGAAAWAISEEGNIIVGAYYDAAWNTHPCYWTEDGKRHPLPFPTAEETGFPIIGSQGRYISEDASIMVGYLTDYMGSHYLVIWRRDAEGNYNYELAYKPFYDGSKGVSFIAFEPKGLSVDGKWISIQVQESFDMNDWSTPVPPRKAARLNLETNELQVLTMPAPEENVEIEPTGIANDGTLLSFTLIMDITGRIGYLWPAGADAKPINVSEVTEHIIGFPTSVTNTPTIISKDGKHHMGFGITEDFEIYSYIYDYTKYVETSGIESLAASAGKSSAIFNLQGLRMNNASAKGLYVIDGKVVMIKK